MYLTTSFDQEYCHALSLNSDYGHLIDLLIKLPSWAKYYDHDGKRYYFIDYGKIIKELPVIFKSKSKLTGIIKELERRGIISIMKVGRSYYINTDEELLIYWKKSKSDTSEDHKNNSSENRTFYKWNDYVLKSERTVLKSEPISTPAISTPMISTPIPISKKPVKPKKEGKSKNTWIAYANAYQSRYGNEPLRNASINSMLCKFVDNVGLNDAPLIAEYYLRLNDRWYQQKFHDVGTLLQNAQAIRTQWINNTNSTTFDRQDVERKTSTQQAGKRIFDMIDRGEL